MDFAIVPNRLTICSLNRRRQFHLYDYDNIIIIILNRWTFILRFLMANRVNRLPAHHLMSQPAHRSDTHLIVIAWKSLVYKSMRYYHKKWIKKKIEINDSRGNCVKSVFLWCKCSCDPFFPRVKKRIHKSDMNRVRENKTPKKKIASKIKPFNNEGDVMHWPNKCSHGFFFLIIDDHVPPTRGNNNTTKELNVCGTCLWCQ